MATETQRSTERPNAAAEQAEAVSLRLRSLQLSDSERRDNVGAGFRWRRLFFWLFMLALVGAGAAGAVAYNEGYFKPEVHEFDVFRFADNPADAPELDRTGNLVPRVKVKISPQVGGWLAKLPFIQGQKVKQGDLLAQIDDRMFQADIEVAQAAIDLAKSKLEELKNGPLEEEIEQTRELLNQAKTDLKLAENDLRRALDLRKNNTISKAELETKQAHYRSAQSKVRSEEHHLALLERGTRKEQIDAAQAEIERAEANLSKAKATCDYARVVAPFDGTILEKLAEEGESVHAEQVLYTLADLTTMEAEVDVDEGDFSQIRIGQPCRILPDAFKDKVYEGRYDRRLPTVERARGVVPVRVAVTNPDDDLLVNMNCRVLFMKEGTEGKREELPRIPSEAVVHEGERSVVYVCESDLARPRTVELGATVGNEVEVRGGLNAGDVVLLPRGKPLADGQAVRPKLAASEKGSASP